MPSTCRVGPLQPRATWDHTAHLQSTRGSESMLRSAADVGAGQLLKLNGAGAYQAAVHCATISAAKRLRGWSRARRAATAPAAPVADAEALSQLESPPTPPRHMPSTHACWD